METDSANHHDPDEDDSESQITVFNVFPEIWDENLIPNLTPTDFQSLINSTPEWRRMFKKITVEKLLPLVLQILSKHWTVSKHFFLVWREVNRGGKSTIDGVLEEALSPKKYFDDLCTKDFEWWPNVNDENSPLRRAIEKLQRYHDFKDPVKTQQFMRCMESSKTSSSFGAAGGRRNTVLTKDAALYFRNPWENGEIQLNLNSIKFDFLAQFGSRLSSVTLNLALATWSILLTALSYLGNVKVLKIEGSMNLNPTHPPPQRVEAYQKFQLTRLELLDVEDLVELNGVFLNRDGVFAVILSHCGPHLRRLICSERLFENPRNLEVIRFSGIRCLKMNGINETLLSMLSSLEEFHLENELLARVEDFLPALNSFSSTLTHFQLSIPLGYYDLSQGSVIDLIVYPKLTKFSAFVYHTKLAWFWPFVQKKMINLTQLNLHEAVFIAQSVKVDSLTKGFEVCPRLQKIVVFWGVGMMAPFRSQFDENPKPGRMEIYRDGTVKKFKFKRLPVHT